MFLYFRQIVTLLIGLYTVRVVLDVLGAEDYGIYGVVGGVVSLFSFISNSMASATQRYFSFAIGENKIEKLKKVFSVNCIVYILIAITVVVLLETIGLWYISERLRVPVGRYDAMIWIFHFSVLSFFFTIIKTPFNSIIIAHEDMSIFAYMSIVESVMKLGIVFLLVYLPGDKLITYGVLHLGISVILAFVYVFICLSKYKECQFRKFYWDSSLAKEILDFTGWTLFGQITTVARSQAVVILINQYFNPIVVAAKSIATTITSQINQFASGFNVSLYPPIIKTYAAGDKEGMFSLIFNGSKITFFLMWIFALPLFLEMEVVLGIWLTTIPPFTILFTRLLLVESLINSTISPLVTAARAPGRIKVYELSLGSIQIGIFIVSWIVLELGGAPYSVLIVAIVANLIMFVVRLIIVRGLVGLSIRLFVRQVMFPILGVVLISSISSFLVHVYLPAGIVFSGISIIISMIISCVCMFYIGLNKVEQKKISIMIRQRIKQWH